ncbi:hypothetical protein CO648_31705 [Rhizobium phaseoli]|nr:hypothetical protein CO648_31705 [Rhizobium phaseoli]
MKPVQLVFEKRFEIHHMLLLHRQGIHGSSLSVFDLRQVRSKWLAASVFAKNRFNNARRYPTAEMGKPPTEEHRQPSAQSAGQETPFWGIAFDQRRKPAGGLTSESESGVSVSSREVDRRLARSWQVEQASSSLGAMTARQCDSSCQSWM